MNERLDSLSLLDAGWDGDGSLAIDKVCIQNLKNAFAIIPDSYLKGWVVFPDARGYLYLDYTSDDTVAGITMTSQQTTYFLKRGSWLEKNDNMDFTSVNLLSILKKVHALFERKSVKRLDV